MPADRSRFLAGSNAATAGRPGYVARPEGVSYRGQRHDRGAVPDDPNLANLLGDGETTILTNATPSNVVVLAGGIGAVTELTFTNTAKYPLLLKTLSMFVEGADDDFVWSLQRGDGSFPIGQGNIHFRLLGSDRGMGLRLGHGIRLMRLNELTFRFQNLSADVKTIGVAFEALQIANPMGEIVGVGLEEQVAALRHFQQQQAGYARGTPPDRGLGAQLIANGRFYTFPIEAPIVEDAASVRFASVDLALLSPTVARFRNETGGRFYLEWLVWTTTDDAADAFAFSLSTGGASWLMTQGAVDSRFWRPRRDPTTGLWTPLYLPNPWVIDSEPTTVEVNLQTIPGEGTPGVWFLAGGTLVGGNVI